MLRKERLAVLIGRKGKTKELIEKLTNTKIIIDSKTGEYRIETRNKLKNNGDNKNTNQKSSIDDSLIEEIKRIYNKENLQQDEIEEHLIQETSYGKWLAKNIIEAINLGFSPEKAIKLINPNYSLEVIDLERVIRGSKKRLNQIKGRIIGKNGLMRTNIEKFSRAFISVYDNMVSIIGDYESNKVARKAINMILEGLPLNKVMKFLEKREQERKEQEFKENWRPVFDI
ncbi:MAG: KH domain-containing protein [Promethearchaeota archaeon]